MKSRFLYFLYALLISANVAYAQFNDPSQVPSIGGGKVELDTIFYLPSSPMPFDRSFYLKFQLPGNVPVWAFTIDPIDKFGKKYRTRRDYHLFVKSGWKSREKRRAVAARYPFSVFKKARYAKVFENVKKSYKDNVTEVVLYVPPLSPSRQYKITLFTEDDKALDGLKEVADLVMESNNPANTSAFNQATQKYSRNSIARRLAPGNLPSFNDVSNFVNEYHLEFNRPLTHSAAVQNQITINGVPEDSVNTYHKIVISSTGGLTDAQLNAINNRQAFWYKPSGGDPEAFDFNIPNTTVRTATNARNDERGRIVEFTVPNTYYLYVLTYDSVNTGATVANGIVNPGNSQLLSFTTNTSGDIVTVTPNTTLPANNNIKLSRKISQYADIAGARLQIASRNVSGFDCIDSAAIALLMKELLPCPCEEDGIKDLAQKDTLMQVVANISKLVTAEKLQVLQGFSNFLNPREVVAQASLYNKRLDNLKASIAQLTTVYEFALKVHGKKISPTSSGIADCLKTILFQLDTSKNAVEKIIKADAGIRDALKERFQLQLIAEQELTQGNTQTLDFVARAKLRIVPDFGFVMLFERNDGIRVYDVTPYLGFCINLRPIDKTIPIRYVRYKPLTYYISVNMGLTLKSLKVDGERDDFFGGGSFITGLGLRLNNYVKLAGGGVWFKGVDPNPVSSLKPLRFSPYAGVSIDFEIQDLFGGLKKLF